MAVETHWDCDKPAISFALAEGDGGELKEMGPPVLVDSCLVLVFTRESSEGIEG